MEKIRMYKIFEVQEDNSLKLWTCVGYTYEADAIKVSVKAENEKDLVVLPVICEDETNYIRTVYNRIKSNGYAEKQDLRRLSEFGCPIYSDLVKKYDTDLEHIFKAMENIRLPFSDIKDILDKYL